MLLSNLAKRLAPRSIRLFSSLNHSPLGNLKLVEATSDPSKLLTLKARQESSMDFLRKNYPRVMENKFNPGRIIYRLCNLSPEEMVENGGFQSMLPLSISNTGSGNNTGSICFSLLPEVTTLFNHFPNGKPLYLYACFLEGTFFAPGGEWRQIIVPGALPVPKTWFAREVLNIKDSERVALGPMIGQMDPKHNLVPDKSFDNYCKPFLYKPKIINYGNEDQVMEFDIVDTPESEQFQKEIESFYKPAFKWYI